ncbi:lipocalin family protein [Motiliproteus sp. MSK22-1]|uniref:lipocalin family protein n=1 Tax=Motiliproteus sp. MSK22-1 TaxID=1897630 RepID=UPI0009789124|nr:lipocalin family protein [Motiliproteus sp. MSK22-1]OMH25765.1 hypothetical protein BGP75_24885 [Motiliproteus sp. MSK22-1]
MALAKRRQNRIKSKKNLKRRRNILLVVFVMGFVSGVGMLLYKAGLLPANETASEWYDTSKEDVVLVQLPADDAPHQNYTEWWYYNGQLQGPDGHRYSFHYTLFVINALTVHTVIHASFVDHKTGKRFTHQSRTGGNASLDTKDRFDFSVGDWIMQGGNGKDKIQAKTDEFYFSLDLQSTQPPVFQGGTGLLDFKEAGKSYYYSRPRMSIEGYAGPVGKEQPVTGVAWFDHQWGDFRTTVFGWEWFALQLDDGADVMIYQLYSGDQQPLLVSGTYTKNGATSVLDQADIRSKSVKSWKSPLSSISYPLEWVIEIPKENIEVSVKPLHQASEFDGRKTTYNLYWEGAVQVTGSHGGKGFLEVNTADQLASKQKVVSSAGQ